MRRLRSVISWAAAILAAVLVPLAVTAHWAHHTLLDTNRYVATLAPLAQDRQFTDQLATRITDSLYTELPSQLRGQPLAVSGRRTVQAALARQMVQPSFQAIWDRANRRAQKGAVQVFAGSESDRNGAVVVDLTPVVTTLIHGVHAAALQPFVPVLANLVARHRLTVTLMTAAQLSQARSLFARVVNAEWSLGDLAAVLAVVALAVARHRWRVLFGGACCTVVATALGFVALAAARSASVSRAARFGADQLLSAKVFDIVDRYLRLDLTVTLIVAAAVALAVGIGAVVRGRRDGGSGGPAGGWLGQWRGGRPGRPGQGGQGGQGAQGGQMGRPATDASRATMSLSPSAT